MAFDRYLMVQSVGNFPTLVQQNTLTAQSLIGAAYSGAGFRQFPNIGFLVLGQQPPSSVTSDATAFMNSVNQVVASYPQFGQVRVGGIIVAPVGPQDGVQKLLRIERTDTGYETKELADVRFVPLIPGKAERL